jgi:hypothetical protein
MHIEDISGMLNLSSNNFAKIMKLLRQDACNLFLFT